MPEMPASADASRNAMAPVVDAAVDYFYRSEMPDSKERAWVESDRWYGAGYAWWRWDKYAGDEVKIGVEQAPVPNAPDTTAPIDIFGPCGAPVAAILHPWEEFHEPFQLGKHLWRGIRERRSKWELIALYPHLAEQLQGLQNEHSIIEFDMFGSDWFGNEDDVVVRHFYHVPIGDPNDKKNPLRAGRYVACAGSVVLFSSRLPVSRRTNLPIVELMSARFHDIAFGYADMWDVLAVQQGEDQVVSDILSNLAIFGRQNMFADEGTDIDLDQVAAGGGVFFVPETAQRAPGFMQPPQMPQSAPWMVEHCGKMKQSITGMNATTRGTPPPNISSGEMAALFTNLAVEFNSDTQMTLDEGRRHSANIVADLVLLNAEMDLLVQITGTDERPYVQTFRPETLRGMKRIDLQTVTPMMRSQAGRMQLFQLVNGLRPEDRAAAILMITTGQFKQVGQTDSAEWIRIKWENEQLAKGCQMPAIPPAPPTPPGPPDPNAPPPPDPVKIKADAMKQQLGVQVSATNDDAKDLPEHVKLYNQLAQNPQENANAIDCVLTHIQDHLAQFYRKDPQLAALLKQQAPPPAPAPQPPQGNADGNGPVPGAGQQQQQNGPVLPTGDTSSPANHLGSKQPQPSKPPPNAQPTVANGAAGGQ